MAENPAVADTMLQIGGVRYSAAGIAPCAHLLAQAWHAVPGARNWLAQHLADRTESPDTPLSALASAVIEADSSIRPSTARRIAAHLTSAGWTGESDPVVIVGGLPAHALHLDRHLLLAFPVPGNEAPSGPAAALIQAGAPVIGVRCVGPDTEYTLAPTVAQAIQACLILPGANAPRAISAWLRLAGYGADVKIQVPDLLQQWAQRQATTMPPQPAFTLPTAEHLN